MLKNQNSRNQVRQSRTEQGMTQEELAHQAGITRQTVGLIEKGTYNPTLDLCLKLCGVLGKTLDQLFWPDSLDDPGTTQERHLTGGKNHDNR
ncbi:helix-turn-helix transcriptional regulator [Alkalispirochaeta americana]|nr:helix-turn-helix transcriptional regulator [Alkalispirochaeta americana]